MSGKAQRTLFIDADACPVIWETLVCARQAKLPVVIAGNSTQNLEKHIGRGDPRTSSEARGGFWVDVLDVSVGADSADFAIVECLSPGDVVVTQDIGLASMALGRGASAIGVRGHIYRQATIDVELLVRHEEKKLRRSGGRTGGPAPFMDEDRRRFSRNLKQLLNENPIVANSKSNGGESEEKSPNRAPGAPLPKVAFVCVHNSCRSQIAEALGKHLAADAFQSFSAGTAPAEDINPDAVRLVEMLYGIQMETVQTPKSLNDLPPIDILITMGCGVECPYLPCAVKEDWGLDDPSGLDDGPFIVSIASIEQKILDLKRRVLEGSVA